MKELVFWGKISTSLITASLIYNIMLLKQLIASGNTTIVPFYFGLVIICIAAWCWNLFA